MRRDGKHHREIASALGICAATASVWTRGVLPRGKQPTDPRKAEVLRFLNASIERVVRFRHCANHGRAADNLFDWRRELGLPRNRRTVYVTDELRERISKSASRDPDGEAKEWAARFYVENLLSTPEIAGILHVTSPTVSDWLKKLNIQIRTKATLRMRERQREFNLGSKCWNWKGGITPDRVRLRISLDMKLAGNVARARQLHLPQLR